MAKQTLFQRIRDRDVLKTYKDSGGIRYSVLFKIFILLITLFACTFFFSYRIDREAEKSIMPYVPVGNTWAGQPIIADYSFPVYRTSAEIDKEVQAAKEESPQVFLFRPNAENKAFYDLETIINYFLFSPSEPTNYLSDILSNINLYRYYDLDSNQRRTQLIKMNGALRKFIRYVYRLGYIDRSIDFLTHDEFVVRIPPNRERVFSKFNVFDSLKVINGAKNEFINSFNSAIMPLAIEILSVVIKPNIVYSPEFTEKYQELAVTQVPKTMGIVRKGEKIVDKGQVVTDEIQRKLLSYDRTRFMKSDTGYSIWMYLGSLGHAMVIFTILLLYLFLIRKRIFNDNYQVIVISSVLILVCFLSWLSIEIKTNLPIEYFVLIPSLAMLIAIIFDSRTAFYVTVTMSMMMAGIRGNDYDTGTIMLFAGTLAAYTVRDIQSRTQMFKSIFFIFIGLSIPIMAFSLERSTDFMITVYKLGVSLINSATAPLITFGLLFLIERISNVTTDLKLQEYDNLNHPLLIKMSENAPGTYQHTLSLAIMAEKCAAAIGANQLLAKVGAYFHDIGKITKAEYFVENQLDIDNKHDSLTPKKSAEAIRRHVSDGVKLAKEYKLPKRITDFIPMHHGTSLIKYFYAKALEESQGEEVDENDFRYPGPKPRTKETAIVMVCDSAEAVSRLVSKDRDKMEKAIDGIIRDKLLDGQFDESNLTFKDLQTIKETCLKALVGIIHPRVEYKDIPEKKESAG